MKKTHCLAVALGISLCTAAAAAPVVPLKEQPLYWGVSYTWATYNEESWTDEADVGAITGRLGYEYSRLLSAELRYSKGVRGDNLDGVEVDLDSMYGIYGKASLPTDINLTPYAIIGFTQGEASGSTVNGESGSNDDSGLSYGVGVDLCRDQPVCVNAEYIYYLDQDAFDLSAFSLGLKVRF